MNLKSILSHTLFFCIGMVIVYGIYRINRHITRLETEARFGLPPVTTSLDSTNLPILIVNTEGCNILRDNYITARMTILYNGEGQYNYSDTIEHPQQDIDYNGYIELRYRGNTSFAGSLKKPYSIRTIDKPLEKGGRKIKSKLLGMRKGKKWILLAPYSDRSMIRDALTFELARNYMDYVPETRFCELILNGSYMGVHILTEQISVDRLGIGKPNKKRNDVTGGYLLEMDRRQKNSDDELWPSGLIIHSPKKENLSDAQRNYILTLWNVLDSILSTGRREDWRTIIDETSFMDCQLAQEFAFNTDGYNNSTFLYKYSDKIDPRIKIAIWDFNVTYGNNNTGDSWRTDAWHYKRIKPIWWSHMMENPEYRKQIISRWQQFREEAYSNENIEHVIDSMAYLLVSGGAEARNATAWKIWHCADGDGPTYTWPNKYVSSSYEDEIDYLKQWIRKRLDWMDNHLK